VIELPLRDVERIEILFSTHGSFSPVWRPDAVIGGAGVHPVYWSVS
jgi:hypothetical protein